MSFDNNTADLIKNFSPKIALGTVQFGLCYGISNVEGKQVSQAEVSSILDYFKKSGGSFLDTARSYGESEEVLGRVISSQDTFDLVTKTPKWSGVAQDDSDETNWVHKNFEKSSRALFQDRAASQVYGLMLHDETNALGETGRAFAKQLGLLKESEKVSKVGVSFYSPELVIKVLKERTFPLDLIQVPFSLLDRRFFTNEHLDLYAKHNVEVHVRSVFLQGLYFFELNKIPQSMEFARADLSQVWGIASELKVTPANLSLSVALNQPAIHRVVLGFQKVQEIQEIFNWPKIDYPWKNGIEEIILNDERVVNPGLWPKKRN